MFSLLRSIHRLTQLERLDLGSNEFSDVVRPMFCKLILKRGTDWLVSCFRHWDYPLQSLGARQWVAHLTVAVEPYFSFKVRCKKRWRERRGQKHRCCVLFSGAATFKVHIFETQRGIWRILCRLSVLGRSEFSPLSFSWTLKWDTATWRWKRGLDGG